MNTNVFNSEEWIMNVNVQILTDTETGNTSIGWQYPSFETYEDMIRYSSAEKLAEYIYGLSKFSLEEIKEILKTKITN